MLDLVHVASFLAIVEDGSFHGAARRLGLAQPTVSQHLRKLETHLGACLVERGGERCRPTAQGAVLLPYARSLVAVSRQAENALAMRHLTVAAGGNVGTYLLPPILARYEGRPERAEVVVRIGTNPDALEWLDRGEADVALTEWWDGRPGLSAVAWRRERLVAIVPPGHPWAERGSVPAEALRNAPLIGGEPGTGTGRVLRDAFGRLGYVPAVSRQMGTTEGVKRAVQAGLGVSLVLEAAVADEARAGTLVALDVDGVQLEKTLYACHRDGLPASSPIMGFVRDVCG